MKINDTVYYWKDRQLEEATVFMFGGDNQVLLDNYNGWELRYVYQVIPIKEMTEEDWKNVSV